MASRKKLQVFISSTYADLKEERQAAVLAILTAGHIPAGMELFTAGDDTQMEVIKRWIDESDVYLLILGGRYGSIEPKSGKSYTQLEFEYAVENNKPLFSVVINEEALESKVQKGGTQFLEKENPKELKAFRDLVCSRMVRFWDDEKDIKIFIHETLPNFLHDKELEGWVKGSDVVNSGPMAEELTRLSKENAELRELIRKNNTTLNLYNGLTFEELYEMLLNDPIADLLPALKPDDHIILDNIRNIFGDQNLGLLHAFYFLIPRYQKHAQIATSESFGINCSKRLGGYGLVKETDFFPGYHGTYELTASGLSFKLRLQKTHNLSVN
ncbi:DUF4062 domain-containing protein [Larkinella soli]|uniref:DUF4062 domain-containing protein n=1 Tax=Larkinella soli TaxID=1770527 RepID=UPI000FFC0FDF|nr:DUF4062 domain-containing protein [Larkinella soli]